MITISELLKAAGVSRRTLSKWQDLGLLPAPHVSKARSGPGQVGYWPDDTLDTVKFIQERQARGLSLESIRDELVHRNSVHIGQASPAAIAAMQRFDTTTVELPPIQRDDRASPRNAKGSVREYLECSVFLALQDFLPEDLADRAAKSVVTDERLGWALFLASIGYMPVLVITNASNEHVPAVMPDFVAGQQISGTGAVIAMREVKEATTFNARLMYGGLIDAPRVLIPLFRALEEACALAGVSLLPNGPRVFPAQKLEILRTRKDRPDVVDAAVEVDYSVFPIVPGPFGWLGFSLRQSTQRVLAMGQDVPRSAPPKPAGSKNLKRRSGSA